MRKILDKIDISIGLILISVIIACFILPIGTQEAYSSENNMIDKLGNETIVIGCYNQYNKKGRLLGENETGCFQKGDHNISIPPKSHLSTWREFWTDRQIINRLAIVNFESNFRENVGNKYAYGYVQTLRKWNISPDIRSQLEWMYKRQLHQGKEYSGNSKRCGYYWNNYNYKDGFNKGEEGVLVCLYRYHYHAYNGTWYARKAMEARKVYFLYFNIK